MLKQSSSLMLQTSTATMALSLLEAGDYHQAFQAFQQVPESDRTPDDWVNQAVCLLHLDQTEAALHFCDEALVRSGHHPQAWLFKGVALHRLNRYDEAYACYAQASSQSDQQSSQKIAEGTWHHRWQSLKGAAKQFL